MQSKIIAHVLCICLAGVAICAHGEGPRVYHEGVVAADHEQASQAGARMLALGGNAVDAAVATSFALSVVRPQSCGIGGGGFMVISLADDPDVEGDQSRVVALNYRETAPAAMGPDYFEKLRDVPEASMHTGHAVGVPGTVPGLLHALETYGTLDRATVLAPAIELARDGFWIDVANSKSMQELRRWFEKDSARQDMPRHAFAWDTYALNQFLEFTDVVSKPWELIMANPGMADALQIIADEGVKGWHERIAPAIARTVQAAGGAMTVEDITTYELQTLEPLKGSFGDFEVFTMPVPSSGGVALLQVLGIIDRLRPEDVEGWGDEFHLVLIEAMKHAFADRARWLADGVDASHLLDGAYVDDLASRIEAGKTYEPEYYGSSPQIPDDSGTSHLSVVDRFGNAVACTETLNLSFGSKIAVDEFGFFLNNEIDDFTTLSGEKNYFNLVQSDANLPSPGKRPLSSMTPTIVLDAGGEVVCVVGGSGGPRIITGTMQVLLNTVMFGMDAPESVGTTRFHHQWMPNRLLIENQRSPHGGGAISVSLESKLKSAGHQMNALTASRAVQAISRHPGGGYTAASDRRKGGAPVGTDD